MAAEQKESEADALEQDVDAAIAACGGDARAAIRSLIATNDLLWKQIKISTAFVSSGYARGLIPKDKI